MSNASPTDARFTLRDLPLPAKLVVTCFLLAVGLGYTSAAVQLHFADSKSGKAMPTVEDVVLKFTGKKWMTAAPPRIKSRLEEIISGEQQGELTKLNMTPAFFDQDGDDFRTLMKGRAVEGTEHTLAEREGERAAVVAWINATPEEQQKAYEADRFSLPADLAAKPITKKFVAAEQPGKVVKIKDLLDKRCARCHAPSEQMSKIPLNTYATLREHMHAPAAVEIPPGGGWGQVTAPIGLAELTRSTHAHLLSFAMLFSLTGLVFAFTSYPAPVRCVLAPWVVVAVVTDVSFWWLARMCTNWGPYFAMGVMATGAAAGMGLGAQITLSLWNMYGPRGKVVVAGLFALGGVIGGMVYMNQVGPGLDRKQNPPAKPEPKEKGETPTGKVDPKDKEPKNPVAVVPESKLELLLRFPIKGPDGKELATATYPFKGDQPGGMVRAFFERDEGNEYSGVMKDPDVPQAEKDRLTAERRNELAAVLAWAKLPDADRRKAFADNSLALPPGLAGKPFTAAYLDGDKVKIERLLAGRCARCHMPESGDSKAEKFPLDTYEGLLKYLDVKPAGKADAGNAHPGDAVVAAPIPAAKE